MLTFDDSYFLGETRDGFYIEPMMKCAWAAQLEVMCVIKQICEKYDIPYFAYYGTLLGTIRHKGFIPWDDDMDICMLRKDYTAGRAFPDAARAGRSADDGRRRRIRSLSLRQAWKGQRLRTTDTKRLF